MIMFAKSWFANFSLESWVAGTATWRSGASRCTSSTISGSYRTLAVAVVVEPPVGRLGESDEDVRVLDHGAVDVLGRRSQAGLARSRHASRCRDS